LSVFSQWAFRCRILAVIVAISLLPLAITAAVEWREASKMMDRANETLLNANAIDLAGDLDALHDTFRRLIERTSRAPELLRFIDQRGATGQIDGMLQSILKTDPRVRDVTVFDATGNVLAATDSAVMGRNYSYRRYFREAIAGSASVPEFIFSTGEPSSPSVTYAAPIRGRDRVLGVVMLLVHGSAVWDILREGNDRAGKGSFVLLLDQHGVILGHSADDAALFHPAARLGVAEIEHMVEERRFAAETRQVLEVPYFVPGAFERARGEDLPSLFPSPCSLPGEKTSRWRAGSPTRRGPSSVCSPRRRPGRRSSLSSPAPRWSTASSACSRSSPGFSWSAACSSRCKRSTRPPRAYSMATTAFASRPARTNWESWAKSSTRWPRPAAPRARSWKTRCAAAPKRSAPPRTTSSGRTRRSLNAPPN